VSGAMNAPLNSSYFIHCLTQFQQQQQQQQSPPLSRRNESPALGHRHRQEIIASINSQLTNHFRWRRLGETGKIGNSKRWTSVPLNGTLTLIDHFHLNQIKVLNIHTNAWPLVRWQWTRLKAHIARHKLITGEVRQFITKHILFVSTNANVACRSSVILTVLSSPT